MADYGDGSVADLQELYRKAKGARSKYIGDWYLNASYFAGEQWCNYQAGRLFPVQATGGRELVTDNRIMPVVTHRVSRKVKNKPSFVCTPQNLDETAVESARMEQAVLEADWELLNLQDKLFLANLWADVCCDGFWKIYWDSTIGERSEFMFGLDNTPLYNPADGTPIRATEQHMLPPETQDLVQSRTVALGDVCVEVISPLELFPDPLATSMDDIEWMVEEKIRSPEYIKQRYPNDINGNPFTPLPDADMSDESLSSVSNRLAAIGLFDDYSGYEATKVYEYWRKPNAEYPKGKKCVWINDTKIEEDLAPLDPMPYVKFSSIRVPGRFWSQAVTSHLRNPQESLNKIRTQILENAKRLGNPSVLESKHAHVEMHGVVGERIRYDSSFPDSKPEYLIPPPIQAYVENEVERIENSINEISGIHEVSKATVPTGVTAASAINLLQEQDDTRIGPEIQAMEKALEQAGNKILKNRATYNTDERTLKVAGDEGDWDIYAFKNEALGDDPEVRVEAGSSMPKSKAAKQAAMTEILGLIFQYGIQVDERALRRYLKSYEAGALEQLFGNLTEDESQVTREHRRMREGQPVQINPSVDDHRFHVDAHTEYMKSTKYDALAPELKQLFEAHVAEHRSYLVAIVNQQIAQQSAEAAQAQAQQVQGEKEVASAKSNGSSSSPTEAKSKTPSSTQQPTGG